MLAIFVVETTRDNNSDYIYISKLLRNRFKQNSNNVVKTVYAGGKGNVFSPKVIKEIYSFTKDYKSQVRDDYQIEVFLCIDTDDMSDSPNAHENQLKTKKVADYCKEKGFHLVWFHRDVEDVCWSCSIPQKQKKQKAIAFSDDVMKRLDVEKLCCDDYSSCRRGTSNLYAVLKRFFSEKQ